MMSRSSHHHSSSSNAHPLVDVHDDKANMSPNTTPAPAAKSSSVAINIDDSAAKSTTNPKKKKRDWVARRMKAAEKARKHFAKGDVEAMKAEHAEKAPEEHSRTGSNYVKSVVFGGLDGIITTFAVVTAAAGAGEAWQTVLVFGFANALADAWSMGSGECISGLAEYDQARIERKREEWEVQHNIQGEIDEMIEIYEEQGFPTEDARELVRIISKDPDRFVDVMMVEELGILIDLDDKWEPLKQGVVMFFSFILFGIFPLLAYLGGKGQGTDYIFGIACGCAGVGLMLLGAAKGQLTGQSRFVTSIQMLVNGCISGGISFGIGVLVSFIVTGDAFAAAA